MNFVLLRGLIRHSKHWGDFISRFQQAFPQSTILTPDLPGLGQEKNATTPVTIEENVEFLTHHLSSTLNDEEWTVVGLSLGGMVAAKWCEMEPDVFNKVVLMNPSSNLSPFWHRLNPQALPVFIRCFLTQDVALREKQILALTSNCNSENQELIKSWIDIAASDEITRSTFLRQMVAARSFRIKQFDTPCLVLSSDNDGIVNSQCSRKIATFLGAELYSHSQSGHDLAIDAPQWTLEKINGFLAEC